MFSTESLSKTRLTGTKNLFSPLTENYSFGKTVCSLLVSFLIPYFIRDDSYKLTKNDSFGKPVPYFSRDDSYKLNNLIIIFCFHVLNHTIILKPITGTKKSVFTLTKKDSFEKPVYRLPGFVLDTLLQP